MENPSGVRHCEVNSWILLNYLKQIDHVFENFTEFKKADQTFSKQCPKMSRFSWSGAWKVGRTVPQNTNGIQHRPTL